MLTPEEKAELKVLRTYQKFTEEGAMKPSNEPFSGDHLVEDVVNYMTSGNPWETSLPNTPVERTIEVGKSLATPETAGSMVTAPVGEKVGGAIGQGIGEAIPAPPLAKVALGYAGKKVGEKVGRVGAAYVGGVGGKIIRDTYNFTPGEEAHWDQWFHDLHEAGKEQALGEAVGIGGETLYKGAKGLPKLRPSATADPEAAAMAAWMHDNFKKALQTMRGKGTGSYADDALLNEFERQIDPTEASKVEATGGLTLPERLNSRFWDLVHGAASGSWLGGGAMRRQGQTRQQMMRLLGLNLGIDVGKFVEPSDLADTIVRLAQEKNLPPAELRNPGTLRFTLREAEGNALMNDVLQRTKTGMKLTKLESHDPDFNFATGFNGQFVSKDQYRQVRDQLQAINRDVMVPNSKRLEAQRLTALLDKDAMGWMPPDAKDQLKSLQQLERGVYDDHLSDSFTRGILSGATNSRALVEKMTTRPDYRRLAKIMQLIPDQETQDSLKRAVVDKMLRPASLPGAKAPNIAQIRMGLERDVGRKTMDEIAGPQTTDNIDKYLRSHELLQSYRDRGETARVMVSLTQGSKAMSLLDALGATFAGGGLLAHSFGVPGAATGGLAIGTALMLGPWAASKAITSPTLVNQYMRFVKYAAKENASPVVGKRMLGELLPKMIDEKVAFRLLGRGAAKWGTLPDDHNDENYIRNLVGQKATNPPYPEGVELGR